MFAHLHCHTNYSFLRGASWPDELAAAAKARGMAALAVTDTNGFYGAVPFYRACCDHGIKPIFGTEIVCPPDPDGRAESAVFLARNRQGYSELCRIITGRHLSEDFDLVDAIRGASDNVIVLVGDRELMAQLDEHRRHPRVYFELHPAETPAQARRRDEVARWADGRGLPPVAANDVHFVNPHQHKIHKVLRAIGDGATDR